MHLLRLRVEARQTHLKGYSGSKTSPSSSLLPLLPWPGSREWSEPWNVSEISGMREPLHGSHAQAPPSWGVSARANEVWSTRRAWLPPPSHLARYRREYAVSAPPAPLEVFITLWMETGFTCRTDAPQGMEVGNLTLSSIRSHGKWTAIIKRQIRGASSRRHPCTVRWRGSPPPPSGDIEGHQKLGSASQA